MPPAFGATTFAEKLGVAAVTFKALVNAFLALLEAPFVGKRGAPTTLRHVVYAMLRTSLGGMNTIQQQSVNVEDEKTYLKLAQKRGFPPETTVLPDGVTRGHWIGPKTASKVFLFFHGGGYALPSDPSHMAHMYNLREELSSRGHDFSIVFLDYTLAPQAVYPTQLKQAAMFLQHLIQVEGKDPSNIIIGGDSAGGNLTLGLISHLLHPHPSGIPPVKLSSPLLGSLLISPWITFKHDTSSFIANAKSDILEAATLDSFAKEFLKSPDGKTIRQSDNYNEPLKAPKEWWDGIDGVVQNIFIWGGGGEVLVDSIRQISEVLEGAHGKTQTIINQGSAHDEFLLDIMLGYPKSKTTKDMEGWVKSLL